MILDKRKLVPEHKGHLLSAPSRRSVSLFIVALGLVSLFCHSPLAAQSDELSYREAVIVPIDKSVLKKINTIQNYLNAQDWNPTLQLLEDIRLKHGNVLVESGKGRYVNVADYANGILSSLPDAGLRFYRQKTDAALKSQFTIALKRRSPAGMKAILNQGFASRWGDDALYWLGEWAWETGQIDLARSYWKQLIPLRSSVDDVLTYSTPRYPDSEISLADILARLILCSIADNNRPRARNELQALRIRFPKAQGTLAGQSGPLVDILDSIIDQAVPWNVEHSATDAISFAGNNQRTGSTDLADHDSPSLLPTTNLLQWKIPLPGARIRTYVDDRPFYEKPSHCYYPIAWKNHLFLADEDRIYTWDLKTGQPAWSAGERNENVTGVIYPAFSELSPSLPSQGVIGVPHYTLSISKGRLYAKLGSPISLLSPKETRELPCSLICLDVDTQQGKLIWKTDAKQVLDNWRFSGAPLVVDDRLFVAIRRNQPQTEFGVACLNATTGQLLWKSTVASALANIAGNYHFMSHDLLTLGGRSIYHLSHTGSITAIDPTDGTIRWLMTYPSEPTIRMTDANDPLQSQLTPCVYRSGLLLATPNDQKTLMAIDADSGITIWQREVAGGIQHLLGVNNSTVVVSGQRLTGLQLTTGKPIWQVGSSDPLTFGWGRGLIHNGNVFWPQRDEVLIADASTGKLLRRIPLWDRLGETGGNLLFADDQLFVTQENQIYSLGSTLPVRRNSTDEGAASIDKLFPNN